MAGCMQNSSQGEKKAVVESSNPQRSCTAATVNLKPCRKCMQKKLPSKQLGSQTVYRRRNRKLLSQQSSQTRSARIQARKRNGQIQKYGPVNIQSRQVSSKSQTGPSQPRSSHLIALCFGRPITKPASPENLPSFIAFLIVSAPSFKPVRDFLLSLFGLDI